MPGKQARTTFPEESRKNEAPPQSIPQPPPEKSVPTGPVYGNPAGHQEPLGAYSEAPGDQQNRAAQAGYAAAHHAEPAQVNGTKSIRVDEANLAQIIAEENASKSKFPKYPDLDRWELLEKMGDGAFSNVYRARDLHGEHGEVAIKVVRKYEMNRMQVSCSICLSSSFPCCCCFAMISDFLSCLVSYSIPLLPTTGGCFP